jgi:hypothetical protein
MGIARGVRRSPEARAAAVVAADPMTGTAVMARAGRAGVRVMCMVHLLLGE